MKYLSILVEKALHLKFKTRCAERGVTMTDVLTDFIMKWLKDTEQK